MSCRFEIEENDRQFILLALAEVSVRYTELDWPASLAKKLEGEKVFDGFRARLAISAGWKILVSKLAGAAQTADGILYTINEANPGSPDPSITCLRCKRTSYNANDVDARYCGCCHEFLDDIAPADRKSWLEGF